MPSVYHSLAFRFTPEERAKIEAIAIACGGLSKVQVLRNAIELLYQQSHSHRDPKPAKRRKR